MTQPTGAERPSVPDVEAIGKLGTYARTPDKPPLGAEGVDRLTCPQEWYHILC